jgi:hypothetical protein
VNNFPEFCPELLFATKRNGGFVALQLLRYQLSYIRVPRYNKTAVSLCEACGL